MFNQQQQSVDQRHQQSSSLSSSLVSSSLHCPLVCSCCQVFDFALFCLFPKSISAVIFLWSIGIVVLYLTGKTRDFGGFSHFSFYDFMLLPLVNFRFITSRYASLLLYFTFSLFLMKMKLRFQRVIEFSLLLSILSYIEIVIYVFFANWSIIWRLRLFRVSLKLYGFRSLKYGVSLSNFIWHLSRLKLPFLSPFKRRIAALIGCSWKVTLIMRFARNNRVYLLYYFLHITKENLYIVAEHKQSWNVCILLNLLRMHIYYKCTIYYQMLGMKYIDKIRLDFA